MGIDATRMKIYKPFSIFVWVERGHGRYRTANKGVNDRELKTEAFGQSQSAATDWLTDWFTDCLLQPGLRKLQAKQCIQI